MLLGGAAAPQAAGKPIVVVIATAARLLVALVGPRLKPGLALRGALCALRRADEGELLVSIDGRSAEA